MSGENDARTPGRRLWDRIQGSEISDGSHYFTMANPAKKAAFERVGAEIEAALSAVEAERDEWKTQHGYAMEGQQSWKHTAERNLERAERAERAECERDRGNCKLGGCDWDGIGPRSLYACAHNALNAYERAASDPARFHRKMRDLADELGKVGPEVDRHFGETREASSYSRWLPVEQEVER